MRETVAESFELLMEENVLPVGTQHEWQGFRDNQLYTIEVNDLLHCNLAGLRKVYGLYRTATQKHMTMEDALDLFCFLSDCGLSLKDATYCYGMAKMTCANENEDSAKKYQRLLFVEFLEMIGRVADHKFQGSELEALPLDRKIEFVLDEVFSALPKEQNTKRQQPDVEIEEETESDPDY